MLVAQTLEPFAALVQSGSCVTIGNFDGVHTGHQTLLKRVLAKAREQGLASVAITFDPHPLRVLQGSSPPFITLTAQKLEIMEGLGLDGVYCLPFSRDVARLEPEEFVRTYMVDGLNIKELVIGHDYAFGKERRGDFHMLRELGEKYGFGVEQIPPVVVGGGVVSSTRIRKLVEQGRVGEARPLLGRCYRVVGQVVQGRNRGARLLGFPTANLALSDELFPKPGVYAVWAEHQGRFHPAVANIGYNPTFGNDVLSVEVHILDYAQDIYGQDLRVHFVARLRPEKKFAGVEELMAQIHRDIATGRELLAKPGNQPRIPAAG